MALCFVLDANLFISLARVGTEEIVSMLTQGAKEVEAHLVTTPQVLDEIGNLPTVEGGQRMGMASAVRKNLEVQRLPSGSIEGLRKVLGRKGPQSTDVSLMELARQKAAEGCDTVLISNDFKIHLNAQKMEHPYRVASPAVLLHTLAEGTSGELSQRFNRLYHQLRDGEMAYMLKKHSTFPAHPKLSWLMDNLMNAAVAHPRLEGAEEQGPENIQMGPVDLKPLYHHLRGEPIHEVALEPFQNLLSHIQPLAQVLTYRESLREMMVGGWYEEALNQLVDLIDHLQQNLQRSSTQLPYRERLWLRQLYAGELLVLYQAVGLLRLAKGEGEWAEAAFDRCTLLALVAEQPLKGAQQHYLHGLARLHQDYPLGGVRAFQQAMRLAPKSAPMRVRCRFALALSQLKLGEGVAAEKTMGRLREELTEAPVLGSRELTRLGDELYHFGLPDFAATVYREALEWAVTAGEEGVGQARGLVPRLYRTRSFLPGGATEMDRQLHRLVAHTQDLDDPQARQAFQLALAQLRVQEVPLHEVMEDTTKRWTQGKKLPKSFLESWEVVAAFPIGGEEGLDLASIDMDQLPSELRTAVNAAAASNGPLPAPSGNGARTNGDEAQGEDEAPGASLLVCNHPTLGSVAYLYPVAFSKSRTESFTLHPQPRGEFKLLPLEAALTGPFSVRGVMAARTPEALKLERSLGLLNPEDMVTY